MKILELLQRSKWKTYTGTTNEFWSKLEPLLPEPWRDLPASYGGWKNTHRRFCRWRDKGIWEKLMEQLIGEHELEWLIMDASYVKAHMYSCGARGGNQGSGYILLHAHGNG